jgi:hypothetical protein
MHSARLPARLHPALAASRYALALLCRAGQTINKTLVKVQNNLFIVLLQYCCRGWSVSNNMKENKQPASKRPLLMHTCTHFCSAPQGKHKKLM